VADLDAAFRAAGLAMVPWSEADVFELFEWHACDDQANCSASQGQPCACAGTPWPSTPIQAAIRAAAPLIRAAERAKVRAELLAIADAPAPSPAVLLDEFHRRPGVDCPQPPTPDVNVLGATARLDYIAEELAELRAAVEAGDVVATADGLADLVYVIYGAAWRFNIPLDAVVAEVHRSNMTKTPTPDDGKAVKGPGYSPPNVAGVLGLADRIAPEPKETPDA
jgi:hypothetical protein